MVQPGTIIEDKPLLEEVFRCISQNDIASLKNLLMNESTEGGSINVIEMRDARKFTVLSYSCYKNHEECFMVLYDHALDKNLNGVRTFEGKSKLLSDWANTLTDEEFTALHFATYHGNFNLIKFLIDNAKADIYKRNKFGSSVLHIAAQGDQALPLFFFHKKCKMDINIRDNR
jgi:ankyrin repeat protein